ncbi:MAG TPA: hypothetical protein H9723_10920 [Candidatus Mediterraneibacter stercoravium]|uniref:Uncharacterized protein n=1 Tax=Candidatus Mediterraneibacter stercoravium TaxID=2838685 RepID=A0A9D2GBP2_9FIRM|nr:hypothetical protein [Candidatus Mediterraneibacter stercoravium]
MYIRKAIIGAAVLMAGIIILGGLTVLYCFTETNIPTQVYLISWMMCLYVMLACSRRISES